MNELLCKLWRFLLGTFEKVVDFVASALTTVGTAVVDVLGELVQSAGNVISDILFSNPLVTLGALGLGGYFLLGALGDDDEGKDPPVQQVIQPVQVPAQEDF